MMMKIKNKKLLLAIGVIVVTSLVALAFIMLNKNQKNKGIDSGGYLPKASDEDTTTETDNSNNSQPKTTEQKNTQVTLTINTPVEGDVVSTNRAISGTALNVGNSIDYLLYGEGSGELANGTISLADNSTKEVSFSTTFSFVRKPLEGDTGFLVFYSGTGSGKIEIKRVGVNF